MGVFFCLGRRGKTIVVVQNLSTRSPAPTRPPLSLYRTIEQQKLREGGKRSHFRDTRLSRGTLLPRYPKGHQYISLSDTRRDQLQCQRVMKRNLYQVSGNSLISFIPVTGIPNILSSFQSTLF